MVLLNVALLTPHDVLLARSFVPLTKQRQDHLLRSCCRLLEIETDIKEHSFIEADSVRYLYLPIGEVYLVLTTTKGSNVVEDLTTLRLLQTVVQNKLPAQITPEMIEANAFDLIFSFNECVSFGHRESVTLKQIEAYVAAESYEEEIARQLRKQKEEDEKRKRREKALELERKRQDDIKASRQAEQRANLSAGAAMFRQAFEDAAQGALSAASTQQGNPIGRQIWGNDNENVKDNEEEVTNIEMDSNPVPVRKVRGMQLGGRGGLRGL